MKNYILYTVCVFLVVLSTTATHAQQPTRDMSRFTKGPLAPTTGKTALKSAAIHLQRTRDLNQFAGKAPLAPGSGMATVKSTNRVARKATATSVNLPSVTPAEKKQAAKTMAVPAGPPTAVTEQENAKPAAAPKSKTLAKPAPAKP